MIQDPLLRTGLVSAQGPQVNAQPRVSNARAPRVQVRDFSALEEFGARLAGVVRQVAEQEGRAAEQEGRAFVADNQAAIDEVLQLDPEERERALSGLLREEGGDYRAHPKFQIAVHREAARYTARQAQSELNDTLASLDYMGPDGKFRSDPKNTIAQDALTSVLSKYREDPLFRDSVAAQVLKPALDQVSEGFLAQAEAKRLDTMADWTHRQKLNGLSASIKTYAREGGSDPAQALLQASVADLHTSGIPVWESFSAAAVSAMRELEAEGDGQDAVDLANTLLASEVSFGGQALSEQADLREALLVTADKMRDRLAASGSKDLQDRLNKARIAQLDGADRALSALGEVYESGGDLAAAYSTGRELYIQSEEYQALSEKDQAAALEGFEGEYQDFVARSQTGDAGIFNAAFRDLQEGTMPVGAIRDFFKSEEGRALSVQQRLDLEKYAASQAPAESLFRQSQGVAIALGSIESAASLSGLPQGLQEQFRDSSQQAILGARRKALSAAKEIAEDPALTETQKLAKLDEVAEGFAEKQVQGIRAVRQAELAKYDQTLGQVEAARSSLDFSGAIELIENSSMFQGDEKVQRIRELQGYQTAFAGLRERALQEVEGTLRSKLASETDPDETFITGSQIDPVQLQDLRNRFLATYDEKAKGLSDFTTLQADNSGIARSIVNDLLGVSAEDAEPIEAPQEEAEEEFTVEAQQALMAGQLEDLDRRVSRNHFIFNVSGFLGTNAALQELAQDLGIEVVRGTSPAQSLRDFAKANPDRAALALGPLELQVQDLLAGSIEREDLSVPLAEGRSYGLVYPLFNSKKALANWFNAPGSQARADVARVLELNGLDPIQENEDMFMRIQASLIELYR